MNESKVQILPLRRPTPPGRQGSDSSRGSANSKDHPPENGQRPVKKSRQSKPKVKTGCATCKLRRIKCDETRPECQRCSSTGRKCDGYIALPRRKKAKERDAAASDSRAVVPISRGPSRSLGLVTVSKRESSAFDFFFVQTATSLSRFFDAASLIRFAMRMSGSESSIRHAMMAVGALHRQHAASSGHPAGSLNLPMPSPSGLRNSSAVNAPLARSHTDYNDPFVIAQYNQAISLIYARFQDPENSVEISLVACILFMLVEFIRGDMELATRHFNSGMNIALAWAHATAPPAAVRRAEMIQSCILPFLHRVELLSAQLGNETDEYSDVIEIPEPASSHTYGFASIQQARDSAVRLMNSALKFIRHIKRKKTQAQSISDQEVAQQTSIRHKLESWVDNVTKLVSIHQLSQNDLDAINVVRVHEIVTRISLHTCIGDEEIRYDRHFADFELAIAFCEKVQESAISNAMRDQQPTTFLFDMEVVSQLYYIGTKCRHPLLRRRAYSLLQRTFRQEGIWDSYTAANIVYRIIELEEVHIAALDGSQLPSEQDRIQDTSIFRPTGGDTEVTFYSVPGGPLMKQKVWKQTILPVIPPDQTMIEAGPDMT